MERVQYSLESSLPELKDLQTNGIFSPLEIKEIIKRRTHFETQLVRRQPRKKDFLEYVEYEMALEKLRKRRSERLKTPIPHSLSSHSLIQRQFSIFERALRKFQGDLRLWIQYIEVAKRERASNLVSRVVARALKLHPSAIPLYILAAQHELEQGSPSAARNLLQRGLRLNDNSVELWCEYVRMELGWCEFLRRRWETLGISTPESDSISGVAITEDVREMDVDSARKEVLTGAIVKEVLKDALNAQATLRTFHALLATLQDYPTALASSLIPYLYQLLAQISSSNFKGINRAELQALYASRHFYGLNLSGSELVNGLKLANEELLELCKESGYQDGNEQNQALIAYASFVTAQWRALLDPNLRLYLSSSLHNLCRTSENDLQRPSPGGDAIHLAYLRILLDPNHPSPIPTPQRVLKVARKYTLHSNNSDVWTARLEAEKRCAGPAITQSSKMAKEDLDEVSRQARVACGVNGSEDLWTWNWNKLTPVQREALLKESFSLPSSQHTLTLQNTLFLRLLSSIYSESLELDTKDANNGKRMDTVLRLLKTYLSKPPVYRHAFELEAALPLNTTKADNPVRYAHAPLLEGIYRLWVDASNGPGMANKSDATFAYAGYLLNIGSVKEATILVNNLFAATDSWSIKQELEKRWRGIVDGVTKGDAEGPDEQLESPEGTEEEEEAGGSDIDFVING